MDEILHRFNPWWTGEYTAPGIERENYLSGLMRLKESRDIVFVTGLRRVGKTTLLHQFIRRLLDEVEAKRILYVSLDNLALMDYSIAEIVENFRQIHSLRHNDDVFLIFDEVHFRKDFELQLKNLYDMGHAKVFASGSASLDIVMRSPYLTGRQRIMRVFPLSFGEYLKFKDVKISPADTHLFPALGRDYITTGGMPEFVLTGDPNSLQALLDSILYRDIAGAHGIRNREMLKEILLFAAQSVSSPVSVRKISKVTGARADSVREILRLFVEANLIYVVEREGKLSERKVAPKKLYLADTGLFNVLTERINMGAVVENGVFLRLVRDGEVRYYRRNNREVDFVQGERAFESRYKRKIEREEIACISGLRGYREKVVITENADGKMDSVRLIPLWKFLLNGKD